MDPVFHRRRTRGYTLIEMIISVVIFSLATLMILGAIIFLYRINSNAIEQAFALASARKSVDKMVADIREAAYSDTGAFPVVSISANEFIFYSDTDRDTYIERIRYFIDGTDLKQGVLEPSGTPLVYDTANEIIHVVGDNIRNVEQGIPVFQYYDSTGTELLSNLSVLDVSFVTTTVIVNVNPLRLPEEFTLRSSATIRTLKTNL